MFDLLGVDFETGEDFHKGKEENFITESGTALWNSEHGLIDSQSMLVNCVKEINSKVSRLTKINQEMINKYGQSEEYFASVLNYQVQRCDYLVAHNIAFDKYYLERTLEKYGYSFDKPWVDTMTDVPYPEDCYDRGLMYLAAYHKIINYNAHRGLPDVMCMFNILENYDIKQVIENSKGKKLAIIPLTSPEQNHILKQHRFRWNPKDKIECHPRLNGTWSKECKEWELNKMLIDLPFRYDVIELPEDEMEAKMELVEQQKTESLIKE